MRLLRFPVVVVALTIFGLIDAQAAPPTFTTLQPGQFREIEQNLRVNIVFVGYGTFANVNQTIFKSWLPTSYRSINRVSSDASGKLDPTGNRFTFDYNVVTSPAAFDDAFFNYLSAIAVAKSRTGFQNLYNQQRCRSLNIGQNYEIDSTMAEKWLAENAESMLGVNTRQYTIFFVNWYGRNDFKFHVYTNTRERDIDLGTDLGHQFFSQTIGGGGTPADDPETPLGSLRRVWFYDLSAGPEYNTVNWALDIADVDGDGIRDWRMPPIWEYGNSRCYRPFNTFSSDHGRIARFVAIDLLFTTSPLYRVSISAPLLPSTLQLDVNVYEGNPERIGQSLFSPVTATSKLSSLQPFNQFSGELTDLPFDGEAARAYGCHLFDTNCYGNRFPANLTFGDLYLYHNDHLLEFLEGDANYEIPAFVYLTTDDDFNFNSFFIGVALANYSADGTQSMIIGMIPEFFLDDYGVGPTTIMIHEAGHHLGLSHPHDGYDYEFNIRTAPTGPHFFIWAGDSSSTVMGYNWVNEDFSQFDRDNMARFSTAAYINQSNSILVKILASPRAEEVSVILAHADLQAANALSSYQNMDYAQAVVLAKEAYRQVLEAAAEINVAVEPEAWPADRRANSPNEIFNGTVDDFGVRRRRHLAIP